MKYEKNYSNFTTTSSRLDFSVLFEDVDVIADLVAGIEPPTLGVMKQATTLCANGAPNTFWRHLLTFFADRSLLGVHQFPSEITYFHSRPTQFSPHT